MSLQGFDLGAELDARVRRAAEMRGETVFEFLRQAARERVAETLRLDMDTLFGDPPPRD